VPVAGSNLSAFDDSAGLVRNATAHTSIVD
jgi:hypothetical protein